MKNITKKILIFIGCGISFWALIFTIFICYATLEIIRFDKAVAKCKTIQIGMTREEVLAILGKYIDKYDVYKDSGTSNLIIDSPMFVDWVPSIKIKKETGKVEEIKCAPREQRRLPLKK